MPNNPALGLLTPLLLALAILLAGFLIGGRYSASPAPGGVFITDRFTGNVRVCFQSQCQDLSGKPTYPP